MQLKRYPQRGFTLIEVLITLLILAIGLLGLSGLMIRGRHTANESYQVQQALALANDMAERIRSNEGAAILYITATDLGATPVTVPTDCALVNCDKVARAVYDLRRWNNQLAGAGELMSGSRVGAMLNGRGCVRALGGQSYRVAVAWTAETATTVPTASSCGAGSLTAADQAKRRVVTLDVRVCPSAGVPTYACSTP